MNAVAEAVHQTCIRSRVPWSEYAATPGTSITRLKELRRSPLHYQHMLKHPKETLALRLGTAAHVAVLEPERFDSQYAIWSRRTASGNLAPRNGQHWDAFRESCAGKSIITSDECEEALAIQRAVRGNEDAMRYLEFGEPEVTMQWTIWGRPCKGRVDWLTVVDDKPTLVGLKTARDCRHFAFGNQAARLGYHLQWGYYYDGYEGIKKLRPQMKEIVVENEAPYAVVVYDIPDDIIQQGRDEYMVLLEQLRECEESNSWPGPAMGEQALTLPTWVYEKHDDISELGLDE